jgi:hypothetical protein
VGTIIFTFNTVLVSFNVATVAAVTDLCCRMRRVSASCPRSRSASKAFATVPRALEQQEQVESAWGTLAASLSGAVPGRHTTVVAAGAEPGSSSPDTAAAAT